MSLIDVSVGQQLKLARTAAGFDLSTAASMIAVEATVLSDYEDGRLRTPARHLLMLANAYGVQLSTFFERL